MTAASSRRTLLGGLTAAAVAGVPAVAVQAANPDVELLALAEEFIDLTKRMKGLYGEGPYASAHVADERARRSLEDAIWDRQLEIQDRLADLRAKTPAGLVARVRMADAYGAEWREETETTDLGEAIAFDLAEDVLAMFGRGGAA